MCGEGEPAHEVIDFLEKGDGNDQQYDDGPDKKQPNIEEYYPERS